MTAKKRDNPAGPVLRKPAAMAYTGLGQTQFDGLVSDGELPPPIRISDGGRAVAWIKTELDARSAERIAQRDADRQEAEQRGASQQKSTKRHAKSGGVQP